MSSQNVRVGYSIQIHCYHVRLSPLACKVPDIVIEKGATQCLQSSSCNINSALLRNGNSATWITVDLFLGSRSSALVQASIVLILYSYLRHAALRRNLQILLHNGRILGQGSWSEWHLRAHRDSNYLAASTWRLIVMPKILWHNVSFGSSSPIPNCSFSFTINKHAPLPVLSVHGCWQSLQHHWCDANAFLLPRNCCSMADSQIALRFEWNVDDSLDLQ